MTCVLALTAEGDGSLSSELREEAVSVLRSERARTAGFTRATVFTPDLSEPVLIFDDGPPPACYIELEFEDEQSAHDCLKSGWISNKWRHVSTIERQIGFFRQILEPVAGVSDPATRNGAMAFIVRYFGPTDDDHAFARHYIQHHPSILAKFPNILNVRCLDPVTFETPEGWAKSPVVVGNEVVFSSIGKLNAALRSDVLAELKSDSRNFPKFSQSTHHAMQFEEIE